ASTIDSRIVGMKIQLIAGIASRLTNGPINETEPNEASVSGMSAIVTTAWTASASRRTDRREKRVLPVRMIAAIAPNDSQKPGVNGANGSRINTALSASANEWNGGVARATERVKSQTPSMISVR